MADEESPPGGEAQPPAAGLPPPGRSKSRTGGGKEANGKDAPEPIFPPATPTPISSKYYSNLSYWRARRVIFYKNGDPFSPGLEFRFKPGRDVSNMEALLDKLSLRMDLPRGARFIFSVDGERKTRLEELEDGGAYVVSSYKTFKHASYGKKSGVWYGTSSTSNVADDRRTAATKYGTYPGGWRSGAQRRGGSVSPPPPPLVAPALNSAVNQPPAPLGANMTTSGLKPSSGRIIRIINDSDHSVQCRVLLNLRTTQPFEEVLEDLGQVLKMSGAKQMYTLSGNEVRSFSQLRNEFADVETFYLCHGGSPLLGRNSVLNGDTGGRRSRAGSVAADVDRRRRSRSRGKRSVTYGDNETRDYSLVEVLKEEPLRLILRGLKRTFYPPLHHPPADNSPPDKRLQLEWVYGYRGTDTRRNLWVLPTGELLYYVAAVAVLYDRDEDTQRHYVAHSEDIQCMALHPSREMVASGQRAGRNRKTQAHIRIWSTETLQTLYVFGMGEFELGVSAIAFSQLNGGSYVLAVDGGRERILSVWQWQWGHLLGKVATHQDELTGAEFHPLDDNLIITHGKGHLAFWTRRKDGFFERTDIVKPDQASSRTHVTCLQFEADGDVVVGDGDGFITIYSVDSDGSYFVRLEFEAHNKGIGSLVMLSEGTLLSGGERDRKICAWDSLQNYKKITETKLPEAAGGVRTIYPQRPGRNDGNIYVGTTKNNILEGSLQRRFNQVIFGHSRQLWGLAVHPDDEVFATAGHDKYVALWRKHKLVWNTQILYECVSLAFHPFGVALAAGSAEGHLVILNAETGSHMATLRVCGSPLTCISYNPVGDAIAIGSQNGSVYLFRVSRDGFSYKKLNKMRGNQPLTHLDWSTDGNFLQTATADYDLSFWDVRALSPEKSALAMKDVKWYTQTCTVGYLVAGMWNNRYYPMTSVIVTTHRSSAHDLLISGDADGHLRLFRYPCISPRAEYNEEKAISSHVASARFMFNDRSVVTVGGTDAATMLWEVVDD
ncbi:echinoderm microtubule-associated protein-like CG42247 [Ischnura elegans]|uniref:echinoderm microtubule-associated protein-like CG42247 n=1 Tax=Ischnura elegans TaxID=197161 RepID=UPI001ED8B0CA|nr:echinoderm microtubule-associated protein-like CG42247 [Ischnura elegans]